VVVVVKPCDRIRVGDPGNKWTSERWRGLNAARRVDHTHSRNECVIYVLVACSLSVLCIIHSTRRHAIGTQHYLPIIQMWRNDAVECGWSGYSSSRRQAIYVAERLSECISYSTCRSTLSCTMSAAFAPNCSVRAKHWSPETWHKYHLLAFDTETKSSATVQKICNKTYSLAVKQNEKQFHIGVVQIGYQHEVLTESEFLS